MQMQALRNTMQTIALKQAMQQEKAVLNVLEQSTQRVAASNGQRGSIIDILV